MTKTVIRRRKVEMPGALRKKLTGALAMLIIAAIMMVSSTFAWFTLSTAPEVKGITTSIGSNGNLEIVLLNKNSYTSTDPDLGVVSNIGDSMEVQDKTAANQTWGNLVDLSTSYGLESINLLPVALNASADGTINNGIVTAPSYGTDGRVAGINVATSVGSFAGAGTFNEAKSAAGVRAIGVPSELSYRDEVYNTAVVNFQNAVYAARNAAKNTLDSNAAALAGVFVDVAIYTVLNRNLELLTYDQSDVTALKLVFNNDTEGAYTLDDANEATFTAIQNAALAYAISRVNESPLTDQQISNLYDAIIRDAEDTDDIEDAITEAGLTVPDALSAAIAQYNSNVADVEAASSALNALTGTTIPYATISPVIDLLIDQDEVLVWNKHITEVEMSDANGATSVEVPANTNGLFSAFAATAGEYSSGSFSVHVSVTGSTASIDTDYEVTAINVHAGDSTILGAVNTYLTGTATAAGGDNAVKTITPYAYALDFGFRTNAATGTKLLLQKEGDNRVYTDDNSNAQLQGGGTYFSFKSTDLSKFSLEKMYRLISGIRVVFAVPTATLNNAGQADEAITSQYTIIAIGTPDLTYDAENEEYTNAEAFASSDAENAPLDSIKTGLKLYSSWLLNTDDVEEGEPPILTLDEAVTPDANGNLELATLTQNTAQKITAIVYLDGDVVDNSMVANAENSMSASINFQFVTDADLVPMEDAALKNGTSSAETTYTKLAEAGDTYNYGDVTYVVNENITIYRGSDNKFYYIDSTEDPVEYHEFSWDNVSEILTEQ